MNAPVFPADLAIPAEFKTCLDAQRAAFLAAPEPSHAERLADLDGLRRLIIENDARIVAAINADYGVRSDFETRFAEIFPVLDGIHDAKKRLKSWMKPRKRRIDRLTTFPGASNRVIPQPLGVVGVIVPWNFPLMLSFSPLVSIFAAGNRAMVKMSENSDRLAETLIELAPKYFAARQARLLRGRGRTRTRFFLPALRPSDLHGLRRDRPRGHGECGKKPHARDARTRRQMPGDRRSRLSAEDGGGTDSLGQDLQRRPGVPGGRPCVRAARL